MRTAEEIKEIRAEIAERYNMVFPDVVLEPIWFGRRPNTRIDGRFAIVDQNTNNCFNVCTDIYQPVYHEVIIKNVEEAAAMMPEFGKPEIKVSLLADGGKLKVNVKFPEVEYKVATGDLLNPTSDIKSSYDLGWKYAVDFGAYRLVCSNGLKVGEVFESFKKRHLTSLDPNILSNTLEAGMARFSDQTALWQKWADTKILADEYAELWEELPFSEAERAKIEATAAAGSGLYLPQALKADELTMWDAYNVFTQYATHNIGSELRQIDIGPKITRVFENLRR